MALRRLLHWGPITALTIIITLVVLSIVTFFSWCPPIGKDTFAKINFTTFCIWVFLILKYFFTASFIGPGHIPFRWKPQNEEDVAYLQFCEPCQGYKAPRAHHCQTCKRCVMKMDHHCPWINNCVGHYNHKSFTLFLFYVIIGCLHATFLMVLCAIDHLVWTGDFMMLKVYEESFIHMTHVLLICIFFGIGLSIGVTSAVAFLFYYQVKSIVKNETGIETWIVEKALSRRKGTDEVWFFPYDLGLFENVEQVLTWSHQYVGDGITWPVFEGLDEYTLTIEQLEQKNLKKNRIVIFEVTKEYSGSWFPISFGLRTCYSVPWSEEKRIKVSVGDVIHATRIRKHWIYGEKEKHEERTAVLGESLRTKGWLPRCCVEEIVEEGVRILDKAKTD